MISETGVDARPLKGVVADEIRSRIIVGRIDLGARISDKELASELKISRTPVREALLQLQAEGLVVVRPRSGTFVFDLSPDELQQISELRGLFEAGANSTGCAAARTDGERTGCARRRGCHGPGRGGLRTLRAA